MQSEFQVIVVNPEQAISILYQEPVAKIRVCVDMIYLMYETSMSYLDIYKILQNRAVRGTKIPIELASKIANTIKNAFLERNVLLEFSGDYARGKLMISDIQFTTKNVVIAGRFKYFIKLPNGSRFQTFYEIIRK